MDFSKLTQNEKLAVYGAIAAVVGGLIAAVSFFTYSVSWLAILAGIAMLAIVFMPQFSPNTRLPGSKGSLMVIVGGATAVIMALVFVVNIGFVFTQFGVGDIFFLVAVAGAVVMGWAGWKEFQAEGGKFQFGTASSDQGAPPPPAAAPPPAERAETTQSQADAAPAAAPPPPPPAAAPPPAAPPAEEPRADEPMGGDEERRDQV